MKYLVTQYSPYGNGCMAEVFETPQLALAAAEQHAREYGSDLSEIPHRSVFEKDYTWRTVNNTPWVELTQIDESVIPAAFVSGRDYSFKDVSWRSLRIQIPNGSIVPAQEA